ncbi:MAG: hypothetical protein M1834_009291 [Cirrosporium novae-zelandiae]|nr:MAG: hypothetical protein M1834_009291 [Cirrosporium novae-zelandiae]
MDIHPGNLPARPLPNRRGFEAPDGGFEPSPRKTITAPPFPKPTNNSNSDALFRNPWTPQPDEACYGGRHSENRSVSPFHILEEDRGEYVNSSKEFGGASGLSQREFEGRSDIGEPCYGYLNPTLFFKATGLSQQQTTSKATFPEIETPKFSVEKGEIGLMNTSLKSKFTYPPMSYVPMANPIHPVSGVPSSALPTFQIQPQSADITLIRVNNSTNSTPPREHKGNLSNTSPSNRLTTPRRSIHLLSPVLEEALPNPKPSAERSSAFARVKSLASRRHKQQASDIYEDQADKLITGASPHFSSHALINSSLLEHIFTMANEGDQHDTTMDKKSGTNYKGGDMKGQFELPPEFVPRETGSTDDQNAVFHLTQKFQNTTIEPKKAPENIPSGFPLPPKERMAPNPLAPAFQPSYVQISNEPFGGFGRFVPPYFPEPNSHANRGNPFYPNTGVHNMNSQPSNFGDSFPQQMTNGVSSFYNPQAGFPPAMDSYAMNDNQFYGYEQQIGNFGGPGGQMQHPIAQNKAAPRNITATALGSPVLRSSNMLPNSHNSMYMPFGVPTTQHAITQPQNPYIGNLARGKHGHLQRNTQIISYENGSKQVISKPLQPIQPLTSQPYGPTSNSMFPATFMGASVQFQQLQQCIENGLPNIQLALSNEFFPFSETAKNRGPDTWGVVKISNIPYTVTKQEILAFLGRNAKIITPNVGCPIHIIMERNTAKTMDCYVEFFSHGDAQSSYNRFCRQKDDGRHPRLGMRHVEMEMSDQAALMCALFPRAKNVDWQGGEPQISHSIGPYNSGFKGYVTNEELVMVLKHAESPHKSGISVSKYGSGERCPQRTYECMISTLYKFPWWRTETYTFDDRERMFRTLVGQIKALIVQMNRKDVDHNLNDRLLKELVYAGLNASGFSEQQRFLIVDTALPYSQDVRVSPFLAYWPFETVGRKADMEEDIIAYYANLLRMATTTPAAVALAKVYDPSASDIPYSPFGNVVIPYPGPKDTLTMAEVANVEIATLHRYVSRVLGGGDMPAEKS